MTTKIVTALIAGALLAASANASFQSTDASLGSAQISGGCHSWTEPTTSDGAPVFVVVPPVRPFSASAGAFTQRGPHIIFLKPLTPTIQ